MTGISSPNSEPRTGFDYFSDFHVFPRYVLAIQLIGYAGAESKTMDELYHQLLNDSTEQRYSEYRTHVNYMEDVASNSN